jgi:hypothetical protein
VKVYLDWNAEEGRWEVAGPTVDGHPLDERDRGPSPECEHRNREDRAECRREFDAVTFADMPNWEDLMGMLADAGCIHQGWLPAPAGDDGGDT